MCTCEHLAEPVCTSSQMLMVDEVEELVGSPSGERLGEWVVEPVTRDGNYSVLLSVSDKHCCSVSDLGLGPLEAEVPSGPCLMPIDGDTDPEVMADFGFDHADVNLEFGNMSSIKLGLSRICLDKTQCKSEINPCSRNQKDSSDSRQVLSEVLPVASALSGYTAQNDRSLVEVVSNNTSIQAVDGGSSKALLMLDEVKLNGVVTDVVESSDYVDKEGKSTSSKDNSICEVNCTDAPPFSLRRTLRAIKSLQKVQGGKHATKCTKKASSLLLGGNIDLLSKATRKKRSCLSRSVCLSGWGLPMKLLKYFELSSEVSIDKVLDKGLKKGKASQRSRMKNMLKAGSNSKSSEVRQDVPCRPIRLKVTFGKKVENSKLEGRLPDSTGGSIVKDSVQEEMPMLKRCNNTLEDVQFPGTDAHSMLGNSTHTDLFSLDPEKLSGTSIDKYDLGTSPDSEVIDQVLDSTIGNGSCPLPLRKSKKKINKKDKVCEDKLLCNANTYKAKVSNKGGQQKKKSDGFCTTDAGFIAPGENPSSNTSCSELISVDFLSVSDVALHKGPDPESGADCNICSWMGVGVESADSGNSFQLLLPDKTHGNRNSNSSKAKGKSRNKSKVTDATRNQKEQVSKRKSTSKCKVKMNDLSDKGHLSETGNFATINVEKTDSSQGSNGLAPENLSFQAVLPTKGEVQILPPRNAWVCCDDCHKWRCIAAELADVIEETNSRWTCKDNQDQAFADCSILQEKSDADINAELQISDEENAHNGQLGSKASGIRHAIASQASAWMLIRSNLYLHRSRKTQTMDEIMVCNCKLPVDGGLGCSSQCLNTMLNIECVQGTCPCGDLCSNQKFQKRQYSELSWFRCGKKGYGLQVREDISKGQFLIEYIGEVLDLQAYEARQKEYASQGHKHFYFMTLNGNEVIDACAKGNLGRFVNHSCDPNCLTEKWVVNGEICVGLFARKNIRKGEELTFDYNYVRVFGAAAKKCHCGSPKCRGYIGGDPLNAEVVVQGESDDEFPEPVVVNENGEIDHNLENMITKIESVDVELGPNADDLCEENSKVILDSGEMTSTMEHSPIDVGELLPTLTKKEAIDEVHESSDSLSALQTEDVNNEALSAAKQLTSTTEQTISTSTSSPVTDVSSVRRIVKNLPSGSIDSGGRMSEVDIVECERPPSKPRARMKISPQFKSVKSRKSSSVSASAEKDIAMAHRFQVPSYKPKKLVEGSANCHLEGVEEKLNELLDADGGICKRKDASKGYLKLLLLTAASGDSCNGGAIQSNRDLSMILDAILKTKSRGVLIDVINKNGLQMLHNMMKLYRKDFKKIPILRKLLKVLEFLAEEEIITVERINGEPIHPGVESFRVSILSFTEHEDKKVHQIARNFRDRWIHWHVRKFIRMEKADKKRELKRSSKSDRFYGTHHHRRDHGARLTEPMDSSKLLVVVNNPTDINMQEASSPQLCDSQPIMSRPRKRKTRWDQDKPSSPIKVKTSPKAEISGGVNQTADVSEMADVMRNSEDDGPPPGFSFPQNSDKAPPGPIICGPRKRKSRWDQDKPGSPRKTKTCPKAEINVKVNQTAEVSCNVDDVMPDPEDDAPPGFSLQKTEDAPPGFSSCLSLQSSSPIKCPSEIYMGHLQERFNSHLPVAYGIPFSITKQLGNVQLGMVDSWTVAPSIPFQPFPPLPPYPRKKQDNPRPCTGHEEMRMCYGDCYGDQGIPSSSGASLMNVQNSTNNLHRGMGFSNGSEVRYYQQQKWNHLDHRVACQKRFGLGFKENHPAKGVFDDVNHSVECAGNF